MGQLPLFCDSKAEKVISSLKRLTSMTSVWACLVQKACGGVVQLTATKLLGFLSKAGVSRSVQAGGQTHKSTRHAAETPDTWTHETFYFINKLTQHDSFKMN